MYYTLWQSFMHLVRIVLKSAYFPAVLVSYYALTPNFDNSSGVSPVLEVCLNYPHNAESAV